MSRPTNNYLVNKNKSRKHIDFIKTLAEIGEPFNSSLLEGYSDYLNNRNEVYGDREKDNKECFLSILNKIGEEGCQILTDRIVNYIDDVSNIDTTTPSALLSQAKSLGYPYKDKKTVEQLSRLSKCSPYLQNLVWAVSTNATNSKTILDRLGLANYSDISSKYDTESLNAEISGIYYDDISTNIFGRRYLYLDRESQYDQDTVSDKDSPALIDFSWMLYSIFSDDIVKHDKNLNKFLNSVIDFGKYNRTIYAIICYTFLYSQIYQIKHNSTVLSLKDLNNLAKSYMPFLYDKKLFDPIQAAWSILYDNCTLSDYDVVYHESIQDFMKAFNEKLNDVSYNAVIEFLSNKPTLKENLNFVYRLNANSFAYQQLMLTIISDVKSLFGIDIKKYFPNCDNYIGDSLNFTGSNGFNYLEDSLLDRIVFSSYINEIVISILNLGKKIRTLREDLRLMSFRNSYKGTTALIQFSVIEYLRDCITDLLYQAQEKYNFEHNKNVSIPSETFQKILDSLEGGKEPKTQNNIAVSEYWDYTEYFNRYYIDDESIKIPNTNSGSRVDWNDPDPKDGDPDEWRIYGSMKEDEITDFYTKVLRLPKDVYLEKDDSGLGYKESKESEKLKQLKYFLRDVYNSGVFTYRTNNNFESVYSGVPSETSNDSPWVAHKNQEFISKEIHPYIWNFTTKIATKLYQASSVSIATQNAEYELLIKHIDKFGNIVDQYRLTKNFVDSSGYVTRYENREHAENEKTQSYDGIIYPQFGYELTTKWHDKDEISANWIGDPISSGIKQRWYTNQLITLTDFQEAKEISCLKELYNNKPLLKSIHFDNSSHKPTDISGVLGDYCIDMYETAYATDPYNNHRFIYKENGYPFMRKLVNGRKGMLFIDGDDNIDYAFMDSQIDNDINDKFPRIVISKDGTHILLRTKTNKFRSYTVGYHKNEDNETEKALILNCEIECDPTIFDEQFFNDSLIKTIDDDFYILVPKYGENEFINYLFYIKKNRRIGVLKQHIKDVPGDSTSQIFRSGLFLSDKGQKVNINTYYLNKNQIIPDTSDVSAVYHDKTLASSIHQTQYKNWQVPQSSFDVFSNFIQLYSSKNYVCDDMTNISVSFEDKTLPSANLTLNEINSKNVKEISEVSVVDDFLYGIDENSQLPFTIQNRVPFIRMFNINSDAGFNPVYIGDRGRIILQDRRKSQLELAESTGAAFELLGPEVDFDTTQIIDPSTLDDEYDEISNDNDRMFERIHEFYSKTDGTHGEKTFNDYEVTYAKSFSTDITDYHFGYASIVENEDNKEDAYRIKDIMRAKFIHNHKISGPDKGDNLDYVYTDSVLRDIDVDDETYSFNRIYIFLGVNNNIYSIIPRVPNTKLQQYNDDVDKELQNEFTRLVKAINDGEEYIIKFDGTYVFDQIRFVNKTVTIWGPSINELVNADIYLVHVVSNGPIETPNFMLPVEELKKAITDISVDMIDEHIRTPHTKATGSYENMKNASKMNDWEVSKVNSEISVTNGSLVFSLTEVDSEYMNRLLPDQRGKHDIKSVTTEAMNDYCRCKELIGGKDIDDKVINVKTFDRLDYNFIPWNIIDLNLRRANSDPELTGLDETNATVEKQYIIQPRERVDIKQDASNKYIISFWRKAEDSTSTQNEDATLDNVLPNKVKVTDEATKDGMTTDNRPVYAHEHQALGDLLKGNFAPQLMVQWEYENTNESEINLRFNNADIADSLFINPNAGLEYKSLSTFSDTLFLKPGESGYIDVIVPNHIQVGRTIFYNIPYRRVLATNISDNKPKFMLTFLNSGSNDHFALESNNYALVFITSSEPQISNSDIVYVTCYVAPMLSSNQTIPPSVSNAVVLSELSFNFDVANIINYKKGYNEITGEPFESTNNILIEKLNPVTPNNSMSETASTCIGFGESSHQLRINEPIGQQTDGFVTVDMKLNLQNLSKLHLKNAMFTAHGNVIAYDNSQSPRALPIVKVFGCSLDRIGTKHVLGIADEGKVLTVTQNSNRETALQINPEIFQPKDDDNDSNE